jgi:protein-L-isoaspartate(D-aspartate) O-methyltransferase
VTAEIERMGNAAYERQREAMVEEQLVERSIKDVRLLNAMRAVPRHVFMPEGVRALAYADRAVGIGVDQTISQPYMVALMTELLEIQPGDRVLEVGTGSGYQTAILAELARHVVSIERHETLANAAKNTLSELGYTNVRVIVGDGTRGWPEDAPYDAIIVTAGAPGIPQSLGAQLAPNGRLVCPVGPRELQQLIRLRRTPEGLVREKSIRCTFVPLIGHEGWAEPQA